MKKIEKLTAMQRDHMNNDLYASGRSDIHKSWFRDDTVDYWRHQRMYETIAPLAKYYKDASWVSIGDGRFGLDSYRLNKLFGVKVFPTDISENMLREGKNKGLFEEYGVENAETLSFDDNSFDILFCKEAFHHCPRPMVALYEMLRVAKYVVVLIEPNDNNKITFNSLLYAMKMVFLRSVNRNFKPRFEDIFNQNHAFEGSGNYVYSLSNREISKVVHAMDLGGMAFFKFNDAHIKGIEFEKKEESNLVLQELKRKIRGMDNSGTHSLTTTIIFKETIAPNLKKTMVAHGYEFMEKRRNPFI